MKALNFLLAMAAAVFLQAALGKLSGGFDRYVDLTLKEDELIRDGRHVLVAYHMKPKAGFGGYIETAAHFAAESSTDDGSNGLAPRSESNRSRPGKRRWCR